jgi:hypothetical protein
MAYYQDAYVGRGFMPISTYVGGTINQWPDSAQPWYMSNILASQTVGGGASTSQTSNSAWVFPMAVIGNLVANQIKVPLFVSITSANSTDHYNFTQGAYLGMYTRNLSSLSLVSSFSNGMTIQYSSAANSTNASATCSMVYGGGYSSLTSSTSFSTNNAGVTNFWSSISNSKMFPFVGNGAATFTEGQYYGVFAVSQNSATKNNASLLSVGHMTNVTQTIQDVAQNVASTTGNFPYIGVVSLVQNTASVLPNSINLTDIQSASNNVTFVNRSLYLQLNNV